MTTIFDPAPALTEATSLGAELRLIRTALGFGLNEAAGRSQISKAALSQWESGARTPSGPALDRLLATLRVDSRVRARLLAYADPAYTRTALAGEPLGPVVDLGQVLRGMRLRSGLTQSDVAGLCSVVQSSVAAWEAGDSVPGEELLDIALRALNASSDEIEVFRRSRHVKSESGPTDDLAARLVDLHDPRIPIPAKEPLIILLQRDAWRAALHSPFADEILCEVTTWRSSWCKRMGRLEEAKVHARQALRQAKTGGSTESIGFALYYLFGAEKYHKTPVQHRRLLATALKWMDKPFSPFLRGQLLYHFADSAYWGRLFDEGEELARESRDLLSGYRQNANLYPYEGVEQPISMIAKFQMMKCQTADAIQTLQSIPDYANRGFFDSQYTADAYLLTVSELDVDIPNEALDAVRLFKRRDIEWPNKDYWTRWERFLAQRQRGIDCELPHNWPGTDAV